MINTPSNKTANISGLGVDVISWNVNDMTDRILGKKSDCNEFINNLLASQIFLLQETKGGVKIPGYTCYNKLRSSSRSGGLCIGIRREISHLVKNLNTTGYDDIMAVRISGKLIEEKRDIILVNVYDSPENSSYKIKQIKSGTYRPTMDSLREFLANIQDVHHILSQATLTQELVKDVNPNNILEKIFLMPSVTVLTSHQVTTLIYKGAVRTQR